MTANILWLSAMSVRPPRVRTHSFSPFVCHIYFLGFRVVIGLKLVVQPYPSQPALCDFCSSDQRFACTFLQIPPHDGHPWCSAMTFPLLGQSRDFHPLECAHAGRTQKSRPNKGRLHCDDYFSQTWLPTVQDVLHADWQEAWHSPQPPVFNVLCIFGLLTVVMCFINSPPIKIESQYIISSFARQYKELFHNSRIPLASWQAQRINTTAVRSRNPVAPFSISTRFASAVARIGLPL